MQWTSCLNQTVAVNMLLFPDGYSLFINKCIAPLKDKASLALTPSKRSRDAYLYGLLCAFKISDSPWDGKVCLDGG